MKVFSFFLLWDSFFSELKIMLISWLSLSGIICWDFEILIFGNEIAFRLWLFISKSLFRVSFLFEIEGYSINLLLVANDLVFVLFVDEVKLEILFFKDILFFETVDLSFLTFTIFEKLVDNGWVSSLLIIFFNFFETSNNSSQLLFLWIGLILDISAFSWKCFFWNLLKSSK